MPVPESTRPIRRPTVRQIALRKLRDWIEDGTLAPGEVLRDVDIAERLGISRTPVREALQTLEQLGAVEVIAGSHTRVSLVDPQDVKLVLAPLGVLHALAVELATPRATRADLQAMLAANERLLAAVRDDDPVAARQADTAFHDVLLERAANAYLTAAIAPLQHHARRLDSLYFAHETVGETSVEQHKRILEAVERGDTKLASELTREDWTSFRFGDAEPAPAA